MNENREVKKSLKILLLGYDWNNIFENNFKEIELKLRRDRLSPEINEIFLISWSNKTYYDKKNNTETYHLRACFGKLRVIYDFLLIFLAPIILKRKKYYPDIVLIRDFPLIISAAAVKLFFKSKIVFFLGTMPSDLAASRKFAPIRKLYYIFFQSMSKIFIDNFLANGLTTRDYFLEMGIKEDKIKIMTEDVVNRDWDLIANTSRGKARARFSIGSDKKVILSVGRLVKEKGFEKLFRAFSQLQRNDLVLLIAGDGEFKEDLVNLAHELDIFEKVIFAGHVGRQDIWDFYKDADVFILLSFSEGNPTVFREAMYMEIPVIGSKINPIREFVGDDGDRGFLWDEENGFMDFSRKIDICLNRTDYDIILRRAKEYIDKNIANNYKINDYIGRRAE